MSGRKKEKNCRRLSPLSSQFFCLCVCVCDAQSQEEEGTGNENRQAQREKGGAGDGKGLSFEKAKVVHDSSLSCFSAAKKCSQIMILSAYWPPHIQRGGKKLHCVLPLCKINMKPASSFPLTLWLLRLAHPINTCNADIAWGESETERRMH